jgi:hypothetical protein
MPRLIHVHPLDPTVVHHPAVVHEFNRRAADAQLRIADRITAFAGSMCFVYLHAGLFAVWMLVFEASPWPTLTLIVSLEAIFLSTFVMIARTAKPPSSRPRPTTTTATSTPYSSRTPSSPGSSTS